MAKGQMRSNKEARKLKADKKSKAAPPLNPFDKSGSAQNAASDKKKK